MIASMIIRKIIVWNYKNILLLIIMLELEVEPIGLKKNLPHLLLMSSASSLTSTNRYIITRLIYYLYETLIKQIKVVIYKKNPTPSILK